MRLVIADTSPINYLLLISEINLLPSLFGKVTLPAVVRNELMHPKAPLAVRNWVTNLPEWVEVRHTPITRHFDTALARLDAGEVDAISLALDLQADLLLIDDEEGAMAARAKGLEVTGTLGVLRLAGQRRLVDLADAFERIKRTNFRYRQGLMTALMREVENSWDGPSDD